VGPTPCVADRAHRVLAPARHFILVGVVPACRHHSHKEFIRAPLWSLAQLKDANNQYIAAKAKEDLNKARSK
ncbi:MULTISPECIES: hypothetical protein, partial [unclassified Pseudoxanthomonas]|uniref:hypothetical protein n=1 Tax=unclassified Pseudoxanthomonas TaxID=2645906 RepID=UPI0030771C40